MTVVEDQGMMSSDRITNPTKPTMQQRQQQQQQKRHSFSASMMMKFLPNRRRMSEEVKRTSVVLDDYANLLSRDSNFLAAVGDNATVSSATVSLNESVHTTGRPSIVSVSSVGSFQRQEVELGALLGKGHFSKVYEITSIDLQEDVEGDMDIQARVAMSKNAKAGKYAMKRLRKKLLRRPREFTRAAAHLVVEAQYLSKLDHPSIIKLRGSALGGASSFQTGQHDGFFLIIDRVHETLSERIHQSWVDRRTNGVGVGEAELLYQKTHYGLQLASALHYLHERRIIFRDLSPRNMGFTDDHSLQLFDMGLARDLPVPLGLSGELWLMTMGAGSKPYMAPEVATTGLYNLKADVFSWSMVVYEMMMETIPFEHLAAPKSKKPFANAQFVQAVYIDGERPAFEGDEISAPAPSQALQDLLSASWDADSRKRPSMEQVYFSLEEILGGLDHMTKSLALGMAPPRPTQVSNMILEADQQKRLSLSDISNI